MSPNTETISTHQTSDNPADTQTDNLARIATALENIANLQENILSCEEEQLDALKELNHEFSLFSRHGFWDVKAIYDFASRVSTSNALLSGYLLS